MMINTNYQHDRVRNYLGDNSLGTAMRDHIGLVGFGITLWDYLNQVN